MSPDVKMTCPSCQGHLAFAPGQAGLVVPCPHCTQLVTLALPKASQTAWKAILNALRRIGVMWCMVGLLLVVTLLKQGLEKALWMALSVVAIALYFAPGIYARKRGHPNADAILMLNLLLGWTFIGWAVAAVWASTSVKKEEKQ